jgi:hypothetical protein
LLIAGSIIAVVVIAYFALPRSACDSIFEQTAARVTAKLKILQTPEEITLDRERVRRQRHDNRWLSIAREVHHPEHRLDPHPVSGVRSPENDSEVFQGKGTYHLQHWCRLGPIKADPAVWDPSKVAPCREAAAGTA